MVTFGELLGHVITLCGQILVSRTDDDPVPSALRVSIQNVPVCTFTKRPRVYRHHAHMCFNMCAWCQYTQDVLNVHTEAFLNPHTVFSTFSACRNTHTNTHTHTPNTHHDHQQHHDHNDTPHNTTHNITRRQRQRESQRETEKERETRQDETREDETRQDKMKEKRQDKTREDERGATTQDKRREDERGETRQEREDEREKRKDFFKKRKKVSRPSNPPDELAQNVSNKIHLGRIIPPCFLRMFRI